MYDSINVHEAKTQFSQVLDYVHSGHEVILCKAGVPYARMLPLAPKPTGRKPGRLNAVIPDSFFDPLPEAELAAWGQ
jgi:prevent-host-death family protein